MSCDRARLEETISGELGRPDKGRIVTEGHAQHTSRTRGRGLALRADPPDDGLHDLGRALYDPAAEKDPFRIEGVHQPYHTGSKVLSGLAHDLDRERVPGMRRLTDYPCIDCGDRSRATVELYASGRICADGFAGPLGHGPPPHVRLQTASGGAVTGSSARNQNRMADFAERIRRALEQPAPRHDASSDAGPDEKAENLGASLSGSMPPFSHGRGSNVVRDHHRTAEFRREPGAERDISPSEIGGMVDHSRLPIHLARDANPYGSERTTVAHESLDDLDEVADHRVRSLVPVQGPTSVRQNPPLYVHHSRGDFGGAGINSKNSERSTHRPPGHGGADAVGGLS